MKKFLILPLISLNLALPTAHASDADLVLLTDLLAQHQRFAAEFQQYTLSEGRSREELSSGQLWIQQPDHFRWETDRPFPQLIVSDGEMVWIYDEDLEQVTQRSAGGPGALTPAAVLGGDLSALQNNFEVMLRDVAADNTLFELTPKAQTRVEFQSLRLLFKADRLSELLIEDSLGQKSLIMLQGQTFPETLDPDLFRFTVPEGVDLIEDLAS